MRNVIFIWLDMSDDIEILYRKLHRVLNVYQILLYLVTIIIICRTSYFIAMNFYNALNFNISFDLR